MNVSDNELLCELNSGPLVCNKTHTAWYSHKRRIMFEYIDEIHVNRLQINFKKYVDYICNAKNSKNSYSNSSSSSNSHLNKIINFL